MVCHSYQIICLIFTLPRSKQHWCSIVRNYHFFFSACWFLVSRFLLPRSLMRHIFGTHTHMIPVIQIVKSHLLFFYIIGEILTFSNSFSQLVAFVHILFHFVECMLSSSIVASPKSCFFCFPVYASNFWTVQLMTWTAKSSIINHLLKCFCILYHSPILLKSSWFILWFLCEWICIYLIAFICWSGGILLVRGKVMQLVKVIGRAMRSSSNQIFWLCL